MSDLLSEMQNRFGSEPKKKKNQVKEIQTYSGNPTIPEFPNPIEQDIFSLEQIKTYEQGRKLKIENDKNEGALIPVDMFHSVINDIGHSVQNNFIDQPKRCAASWAARLGIPQKERDIEKMMADMIKDGIQGVKSNLSEIVKSGEYMKSRDE